MASELLRLLIDADTRGAVRGIEAVGKATDKELGRSTKQIDAWSKGLTTAGAGMIALGGVALVGLGKAAQASEEANLATVKLENTLSNMPKLAGENSKQFIDLADDIQKVTAADADAIVEAEALLGTFNLTAQEIKGITPLVVDYARKFGVDIPAAAVQVGKALDGNVGALKRNGVSIDEATFATDRYRAVQEALSDQVGGFAQAEGKTFAGSLERLKNELGDVAEGVGVGAVDAFGSLFSGVEKVTGAVERLSPGTQAAIGKVATFGSVALVAAGGLSFAVGQAIKMRENFSTAASAVSGLTTKLGGLRNVALGVAGLAGIAGIAIAIDQMDRAARQAEVDRLLEDFLATGAAAEVLERGIGDTHESMVKFVDTFLDALEVSEATGARFIQLAEEAGVPKDVIRAMRAELEEHSAAQRQTAEDTGTASGAFGEQAGAVSEAQAALQEYSDTLAGLFDPLFGATDALMDNAAAQANVKAAELELVAATQEHGAASAEAKAAQDKLTEAQLTAGRSALDLKTATAQLQAAVEDGTTSVADANSMLQGWVRQGLISQSTADALAAQFGVTAKKASELGRTDPNVEVTATDRASAKLSFIRRAADLLNGKTATVYINVAGAAAAANALAQAGGRQHGGPVGAGRLYEVTEDKRAELLQMGGRTYLIPGQNGQVIPAGQWGGGMGGNTYAPTYNVYSATGDPRAVVEAIRRYERLNGPGWRS